MDKTGKVKKFECKKCRCPKCRRDEAIFIKLMPGAYYVDGQLCWENKITIQRDGKDIGNKVCGVVMIDDSLYMINEPPKETEVKKDANNTGQELKK